VNTTAPALQLQPGGMPGLAPGGWRVDPAHSRVLFAARVAGRPVRGRLPVTGSVLIGEQIEDSAARLTVTTSAVSTGLAALDRLLTSQVFLDAEVFPEITFSSELLVWVPAGWRMLGRMQVKGNEHELACQVSPQSGEAQPAHARILTSTWALDSRWVTRERIPGLGRRIPMTCSLALVPDM
jgi:polyisoprenoid-binding protein YceI